MVKTRLCTIDDASLVADLSRQTFYETFASENSAANMNKFMLEQFSRETLIREVGAKGNFFFLAYDGERPVGYARMYESSNPPELENKKTIEIARLYAVADSIGKGIGSKLMQVCVDIASQNGKEVIWLGVWGKNKKAIEFYKRWGFEKFGTHIFLLGNEPQTDWLMKKELTG